MKSIFLNKKFLFLNYIVYVFGLANIFFMVLVYSANFICVYLLSHEFFRVLIYLLFI